jgi:hypothetical protein
MLAEQVVCGPDVRAHVEAARSYLDAGIGHLYIHQVGSDQEGFLRFYRERVLPELREAGVVSR